MVRGEAKQCTDHIVGIANRRPFACSTNTRAIYSRAYTALVSLLLCDARWMHLGECNPACSGLLKGVVMLRHLK